MENMKVKENFFGKMGQNISVILKKIKLKEKENGNGLMEIRMKVILKTENLKVME